LTPDAIKIVDAWDPAKDEAAGEQCRSYGAPALMSVPGRLHITWQDDNTLKIETDAGTQTRLFHFGDYKTPANTPRTWQGVSLAQWQMPRATCRYLPPAGDALPGMHQRFARRRDRCASSPPISPRYLRKNGIPTAKPKRPFERWDLYKRRTASG
jgi:hypothetical protein